VKGAVARQGLPPAVDHASDHVEYELRAIMMDHVSAALCDNEFGVRRHAQPLRRQPHPETAVCIRAPKVAEILMVGDHDEQRSLSGIVTENPILRSRPISLMSHRRRSEGAPFDKHLATLFPFVGCEEGNPFVLKSRRRSIEKDDASDAFGIEVCVSKRVDASHGVADQHHGFRNLEVLEYPAKFTRDRGGSPRPVDGGALPESRPVEGDHPGPLVQRPNEGGPGP